MRFYRNLFLLILIGFFAGCNQQSAKKPVDPVTAKTTLEEMLKAWKGGETIEQFVQRFPGRKITDYDWQQGAKLLDYSIDSNESTIGDTSNFQVNVTLVAANKKRQSTKFVYIVVPGPPVTVLRE